MSAGGLEVGIFSAAKLWQILTALFGLFIGLGIKVLNDRNKIIEDNKKTITEISRRYAVQEAQQTEMAAQIDELSTVKDKVIVLEAKMDNIEATSTESAKDIKQILSQTQTNYKRNT